jgi:hypothetical protein
LRDIDPSRVLVLSITIAPLLLAICIHIPFHAACTFTSMYPHLFTLPVCALCVEEEREADSCQWLSWHLYAYCSAPWYHFHTNKLRTTFAFGMLRVVSLIAWFSCQAGVFVSYFHDSATSSLHPTDLAFPQTKHTRSDFESPRGTFFFFCKFSDHERHWQGKLETLNFCHYKYVAMCGLKSKCKCDCWQLTREAKVHTDRNFQ